MEADWRHARNTRRRVEVSEMERLSSGRSGSICRHFVNGSCRFGQRCNFLHEWPVIQPSQICRYFQKGVCWHGNRCRYLHVPYPDADSSVASRRGSVPVVSSSTEGHALLDRRGSEPALQQAEFLSRQGHGTSALVVNVSHCPNNPGQLAANAPEALSQDNESNVSASREAVQSSDVAQAGACDGKKHTPDNEVESVGATAASRFQRKQKSEAFLQSKDVTCGICMDKVYENKDSRNQMFGILPNCTHSFCLECIKTWRRTKDLGPDVIKTCPQCRVRSAFYVPNKYWVEGQAKESLIASFKDRFSKKNCTYYERYGCCPFKTECLYRHVKSARHRPLMYETEDDDDDYDGVDLLNFFIAMTLLSGDDDDDDDFDFQFYLVDDDSF